MGCSGTYWVGVWDQNRGVGCPIINCVSGPPLRVSWRLRISRSIPLNRWVPNMNIPSHNIPRPSSFILPPDNGSLSSRPLDAQWSPIRPDINISHLTSPVSVFLVGHPLVTITINHHIRNCLVGWSALGSIFLWELSLLRSCQSLGYSDCTILEPLDPAVIYIDILIHEKCHWLSN